jgi:hypothetical protein
MLYSTFPGRASTVTCVVVQTDLRRPRDQPYLCRQPPGRRKCPLVIISPSRALQHLDGHARPGDVIGSFAGSKLGSKGLQAHPGYLSENRAVGKAKTTFGLRNARSEKCLCHRLPLLAPTSRSGCRLTMLRLAIPSLSLFRKAPALFTPDSVPKTLICTDSAGGVIFGSSGIATPRCWRHFIWDNAARTARLGKTAQCSA